MSVTEPRVANNVGRPPGGEIREKLDRKSESKTERTEDSDRWGFTAEKNLKRHEELTFETREVGFQFLLGSLPGSGHGF